MRWLFAALPVLLLVSGVASAQVSDAERVRSFRSVNAHPAECSRLRRQIDHFENMSARAEALDNELWQQRLAQHLTVLHGLQEARCPKDVPVDSTGEAFKQLVKLAGRAALAYFTFGAAGF